MRWIASRRMDSQEIFVFFKKVDADSLADAGPQLQKVIDFKLELEESCLVFYKQFEEEKRI